MPKHAHWDKGACPLCPIFAAALATCTLLFGCAAHAENTFDAATFDPVFEQVLQRAETVAANRQSASHIDLPSTAEAVSDRMPQPPLPDLASLPAGTQLSADQVAAYGEDACFYVTEIDDALFQRMYGLSYKEDCAVPREDLRYIRVLHVDIEGRILIGELVMNAAVADDVCGIFHELYRAGYPIEKMHLVDDYGADDDASMEDNNTSAFNFRVIPGTTVMSYHAQGLAIDINPYYNPYVKVAQGSIAPASAAQYADRSRDFDYKINRGDLCFQLFAKAGFVWGGDWTDPIDYQHFEYHL
ncbi:M15 family metallopeptidase [Slackia heliotrinireducens]|uniref:M15 family metallopeptidase n=1 Tax=Slackia heliotrinireducens TaxID=84110 RepID=UPI0033154AAF